MGDKHLERRGARIPRVNLPDRTPILPPIKPKSEDQSGPTKLEDIQKANQKKRRHARARNKLEDQRLQSINKSVDLAQSIMEKTLNNQSQKLRRLMEDIEERRKNHEERIMHPPGVGVAVRQTHIMTSQRGYGNRNSIRIKRSPIRQTLASTSCPVMAFSFTDHNREPLGRWVRYPHELPALKNTPQKASTSRNGSVSSSVD